MDIDAYNIILDYLNLISAKEIANYSGLAPSDIKLLLRHAMPDDLYLKTAYQIGARKVSLKLKNPSFKANYSKKMSASVSIAIRKKLQDSQFSKSWQKKAKLASLKGNLRIKQLLQNPTFSQGWSKRCSKAACILQSSKKGIFDPRLRAARTCWSIKGLQKTGRKLNGPNGEKMYNSLEITVARLLLNMGLLYDYESRIKNPGLNGFYSIDFMIDDPPLIIEATYWDKVNQKCKKLTKKFIYLNNQFPNHSLILVTKAHLRDRYKRLLPDNINVLTSKELEQFILG
ncbi:hypothetical protein KKE92_03045 [Candidatus Micrarchaeota archaeon]|nr:hypothetical protein [Candidatus Micrarchaeota archaeon]MBU1682206.1 hypothetical protein [Candidatus Micrarchaeota archaeon]